MNKKENKQFTKNHNSYSVGKCNIEKNPNYDFHKFKKSPLRQEILNHIKIWEDYQDKSKQLDLFYKNLESDHSYIQWIFPNFFSSMFNSDSYRLQIQERNKMIKDQDVMKFYFQNYMMFLKFLGIRKQDKTLIVEDQRQFNLCLDINTHNQMRLRRVLASLSVLGYRNEAIKLLDLLYEKKNKLYGIQYYYYDLLIEEKDTRFNDQEKKQLNNQQQQQQQQQKQQQKQQQQQQQNIDNNQIANKDFKDAQIDFEIQEQNDASPFQESISKEIKKDNHLKLEKDSYLQLSIPSNTNSNDHKLQQQNQELKTNSQNESLKNSKNIFLNNKQPKIVNGKFERVQFQLTFEDVKNYYIQGDLLNNSWVKIELLKKQEV